MNELQLPDQLIEKIEEFITTIFEGFTSKKVRDHKVIHERVWGSNIYFEHEIAILDSPLIQRLRQIHQTGLVFFTYPSALHTRFDHTLGCMSLVPRLVKRLKERESKTGIVINDNPRTGDLASLRMAALLHDCGHAFFSHVSEEYYQWDIELLKILSRDQFTHCKPHEILSYLIVKSKAFDRFFKTITSNYPIEIDLTSVANYIIGKSDDKSKLFLSHIINGPFDVDKLDYIFRDSAFAGLSLTVNLERFLYTLSCYRFGDGTCDLILESPTAAEQILFSKMLLYSLIYHHQKVKASDYQLFGLIEYIDDNSIMINGHILNDPVEFLYLNDNDILTANQGVSFLTKASKKFRERDLIKRAMVICKDTVSNYDAYIDSLTRLNNDPQKIYSLRKEIRNELPSALKNKYSVHEIHISLPKIPSLREATQTFVGGQYMKNEGGTRMPVVLEDLFPLTGWLSAYSNKQWRGHIYCPDDEQLRKKVFQISQEKFKDKLGIIINNKGWEYCQQKESELSSP